MLKLSKYGEQHILEWNFNQEVPSRVRQLGELNWGVAAKVVRPSDLLNLHVKI